MTRTPHDRVRYEFIVRGALSERAVAAFPELTATAAPIGFTQLTGMVSGDQELRAMLARFDALGLTLVEMRQISDSDG